MQINNNGSWCPEHPKHAHFFDKDGFCINCQLWSPDEVFQKQIRRDDEPRKETVNEL